MKTGRHVLPLALLLGGCTFNVAVPEVTANVNTAATAPPAAVSPIAGSMGPQVAAIPTPIPTPKPSPSSVRSCELPGWGGKGPPPQPVCTMVPGTPVP